MNKLFDAIKRYETIIIHRHQRPDLDALGSQLGLKYAILNNFNNKNVYAVGDMTKKYEFIGQMDEIEDNLYNDALVIIVDVAVSNMVSDDRYKNAKEIFVIDHHQNDCDITFNFYKDTSRSSAAEYITSMLLNFNYDLGPKAATCLYGGIITDSGRFLYGNNLKETFYIASKLIEAGANPKFIYDNLYVDSLKSREMTNYFANKFIVDGNVAYLKNDKEVFDRFNVEFNDISRGMLSVMSGIKEIEIWLNFTYDISKDKIIGEFRSRNIEIVEIAKKWGGGGHKLACGATISNWDDVDKVINDFKELANGR